MSRIIEFYRGTATGAGRTIDQALELDDIAWEAAHDIVQWVYPLPEPSRAQPQSPVLTDEDLAVFRTDPEVRETVKRAYRRWLSFMEGTDHWRRERDHNHLRITRIIRFLSLVGMHEEASDVFRIAAEGAEGIVPNTTLWYWQEAMNDRPAWLAIGSGR